jgi:hypothetical protein
MSAKRKVIIFDGCRWHVRRLMGSEHDVDRDEMVYRCDKPLSSDHKRLSDVPEIKRLLARRK